MKLTLTTFIILVCTGIFVFFYDRMGGFAPIEPSVVPCSDITLVGKLYRGTPQDKGLSETFKEVEDYKKGKCGSNLYTMYEIEPAGKLDTLQLFVGLEGQMNDPIPAGWISKAVSCKEAVSVQLTSHRMVMPSPRKVRDAILDFAEKYQLRVEEPFIEKLINERNVEILAPIGSTN